MTLIKNAVHGLMISASTLVALFLDLTAHRLRASGGASR